jgi:tight adherence protein B
MMMELGLFALIFVPTAAILYTLRERQLQEAHRRFLTRRIGKTSNLVDAVKKRSTQSFGQLSQVFFDKFGSHPLLQSFIADIEFAQVSKNAKQYVFTKLFVPLLVGVALLLIQMPIGTGIAVFYMALSYVQVIMAKRKKLNLSLNQLPDLITMISNSLRAGNSLTACFAFAAEEMPQPTRSYFHELYTELQYGIPFKQASYKMLAPLSSVPEYCMFVSAINIQRESGGNLTEVLEILSTTIRERLNLKAKISALTGQSRLTGYILGAAPTMMLLGLTVLNYNFVKPLYTHPTGKLMLGVAIVMQIIGFIVIRKIIEIRV